MTKNPSLEALADYLKKHRLEYAFPPETWPYVELHQYDKGEYICYAGERVEYFSVLVEGRCHVLPSSEDGKTVVLSYLDPVSLNGDIELFNECPALYSVCAAAPVTTIAISRKYFFTQMMQVPTFMQLLCKTFAKKLYNSSVKHSSAMLYPIKTRLSRWLLQLSDEGQTPGVNIRQEELAQYLGITTRHLRRVLEGWERDGLITRQNSEVTIVDRPELERLANSF